MRKLIVSGHRQDPIAGLMTVRDGGPMLPHSRQVGRLGRKAWACKRRLDAKPSRSISCAGPASQAAALTCWR